jgi:hypothetical protein
MLGKTDTGRHITRQDGHRQTRHTASALSSPHLASLSQCVTPAPAAPSLHSPLALVTLVAHPSCVTYPARVASLQHER